MRFSCHTSLFAHKKDNLKAYPFLRFILGLLYYTPSPHDSWPTPYHVLGGVTGVVSRALAPSFGIGSVFI